MGRDVENDSLDELGHEISLVKGGPGYQSGGTPSDQSGGHLLPGGECFAPYLSDLITYHDSFISRTFIKWELFIFIKNLYQLFMSMLFIPTMV